MAKGPNSRWYFGWGSGMRFQNGVPSHLDDFEEFTLMRNPVFIADSMRLDTSIFAYFTFKGKVSREEKTRVSNWLQVRTKSDSLRFMLK